MTNVRKRILQLTALESASLNTSLVGVDGGTTYRIELDTLADAVTARVNILDRDRLNSLESSTGSYLTSLNGAISSSSQLTSSYDTRYVVSGSITQTTWDNIANKPDGIVSQSTDLSALNSFTQSQDILNTAFTNGMNARLQTSSFNDFSASVHTQILAATNEQSFNGLISSSTQISAFGFISSSHTDITSLNNFTQSQSILNTTFTNGISARLQTSSFNDFSASVDSRLIAATNEQSFNGVTTSSYNADSASFDSRINSIVTESGSNLTYFIEAYANETYTLPGGFTEDICRYSVVSATENVPSNWFNTSTYRFTPQKAGYWEIIASYDVYRNTEASMAIRKNGGIVASAGSFNAVAQDISKIIYLNGSTDYIDIVNTGGAALQRDQYQQRSWFQAKFVGNIDGSTDLLSSNNTFTGNNTFQKTTRFETVGGDEGGEIQFGVPVTNTTLQNRVTVDVWQNRLRFFEGSANANGVYIDLSKPTTGNNNEITYKASGIVNAGTFVTLDNIKATVTTSGQRGLSLATVSGTIAINMAGNYAGAVVGNGGSSGTATITTSASTSLFGWGFMTQGDMANYIITDTTNNRAYRIIIQIGGSFNNNLVSIERLH
jgi:hypothetical protein